MSFSRSQLIKHTANQLGFSYCGIAKAEFLNEDAKRLEQWLHKGYNGSMQYMNNYFDLRTNPQLLVPNAKSVITVLKNYYTTERIKNENPKISKYAFGKDYHDIIKKQLFEFYDNLKKEFVEIIDYYKNGKLREIDLFTKEMSDFRSFLMDSL